MLNLFHTSNMQRKEVYSSDFIKDAFNIGVCVDAHDTTSFKFAMVLDATKLSYSTHLNDLHLHLFGDSCLAFLFQQSGPRQEQQFWGKGGMDGNGSVSNRLWD